MPDRTELERVSSHAISRSRALAFAVAVGVLLGIGNAFLDLDFTLRPALLLALGAAVLAVTVFHEGVHGLVARLLGHKPIFGLKPPFVYVTFDTLVPRGHFMLVALAPLFVLDAVFVALFLAGVFPLFADLAFAINTLGAVGDLWMFSVLLRAPRGSFVQDTRTGLEIWARAGS